MKRVFKLTAAVIAATGLTTVAIAGTYAGKTEVSAKADIVDTAVANGSFNTLVAAVQAAGLEQTLRSEGPFTVFAPTDAAFDALPSGTVETLLKPENKDQLVSILTYHVVPGKVLSTDLQDGAQATTVNGAKISVDLDNGVTINDSDVVIADIKTSNGVIHVIDKVLLPPKHH
ncbi:MAG: fasciclin domain-containing protein [Aquisalinus sp.]|nr:fasciclin domain-containing protein [Aquisalinus sp.]